MADDNEKLAGATERTSILPQSEAQSADQTEVLPTHVAQAETAQMPPVTQEDTGNAFAGTPLESVVGSSADDQAGDEAVAASAATLEPAPKKTSWGKRAAIAGAAAAILSVGFGAGIITHAAVMGDGQDYYEQGYEDGSNDRDNGTEDEDSGRGSDLQGPGGQQQGPVTVIRDRAPSKAIPAALARDLPRRAAEAPAASPEARVVLTPQPRTRMRPPAER